MNPFMSKFILRPITYQPFTRVHPPPSPELVRDGMDQGSSSPPPNFALSLTFFCLPSPLLGGASAGAQILASDSNSLRHPVFSVPEYSIHIPPEKKEEDTLLLAFGHIQKIAKKNKEISPFLFPILRSLSQQIYENLFRHNKAKRQRVCPSIMP